MHVSIVLTPPARDPAMCCAPGNVLRAPVNAELGRGGGRRGPRRCRRLRRPWRARARRIGEGRLRVGRWQRGVPPSRPLCRQHVALTNAGRVVSCFLDHKARLGEIRSCATYDCQLYLRLKVVGSLGSGLARAAFATAGGNVPRPNLALVLQKASPGLV